MFLLAAVGRAIRVCRWLGVLDGPTACGPPEKYPAPAGPHHSGKGAIHNFYVA